tara:strand:+ start:1822 stop:2640 length:819 start_codon:yes stop_codon:yes gene_type:complete
MKKVYVLGAGPSLAALEKADMSDVDEVIMINNHKNTVSNNKILEKLKGKDIYVMCNISQEGFHPTVFKKLEIKGCLTNRFKPDWDLWQQSKDNQKKNFEGGTLNNLGYLPHIAEDEPYLYTWRGPPNRNLEDMRTYDGRRIEHMPEEAERYLIPVYEDKLIGNCSYYATLYALLALNATHIVYYGLDFYNNLQFKKSWYTSPPNYGTQDWWTMRVKYEGEHMKELYNNYMAKFFPDAKFEFFTTIENPFKGDNLICNTVSLPSETSSNLTYY